MNVMKWSMFVIFLLATSLLTWVFVELPGVGIALLVASIFAISLVATISGIMEG